jgi:hypothetical protein
MQQKNSEICFSRWVKTQVQVCSFSGSENVLVLKFKLTIDTYKAYAYSKFR